MCDCAFQDFRISAVLTQLWSINRERRVQGIHGGGWNKEWARFLSPSMWESVCWDGERQRSKKSCVCCCSPALQAEIRLINSRDNVEMSSMTSILGAEALQHHCAALQLALCWVNSGSPGRKELIDGPPRLCALLGLPYTATSSKCWSTGPGDLVDQRLNTTTS